MPAPPTLWFDVTTSWHERGRRPNGTLRIERSYARQARERFGQRLRFCRYNPATGRFLAVPADAVERLYATSTDGRQRPAGRAALREAGRRLERGFRRAWRSVLPALLRLAGGGAAPFAAGDVLILVGETWGGMT